MQSGATADCLHKSVTLSLFPATYPTPTSSKTLNTFLEKVQKRKGL
jgi:hypothetical protein